MSMTKGKIKDPGKVQVGQIKINLLANGGVNVENFPDDCGQAFRAMFMAIDAITAYFLKGVADNTHDAQGHKKDSDILVTKQMPQKPALN